MGNFGVHPNAARSRREAAISLLACVGISVIPILAYVVVWEWTAPDLYLFLGLGTYLLLGGFALWQLVRAVQMDDWTQQLGTVGVVVGFAVTIFLGLRPGAGCLDTGPCLGGLTLHPLQFALGLTVTSLALFLDVRNRADLLDR